MILIIFVFRWNFTYYNSEDGEIFECIEKIDRKFMELVETQNPQ